MSEPLSVNPDDLRTAAAHLADISAQMKQVRTSLNAQLSALGSPWGDDSVGDQFANGSSGYIAQVDQVNSSIGGQTEQLDSLAQSLTTSASNFEQLDQQQSQTPGVGNIFASTGSGSTGGPADGAAARLVSRIGNAPSPMLPAVPAQPAQQSTLARDAQPPAVGAGPAQQEPLARSALPPEVPAQPAQAGMPVSPGVLGTPTGSALLTEVSGPPTRPGQPGGSLAAPGGVLSAAPGEPGNPLGPSNGVTAAAGEPGSAVAPTDVVTAAGPSVQPSTAASADVLSAVPGQPGGSPASGAALSAVPGEPASPFVPSQVLSTTSAPPATEAGNVLTSVVPPAATSASAPGPGALMQVVETLAEPAGEGVSAAMQAVQSGTSAGSGAPSGPVGPDQVPGAPAAALKPAK